MAIRTRTLHGIELQFERRSFYCGQGPVRGIWKYGWVILRNGVVIAGDRTRWLTSISTAKEPVLPTFADALANFDGPKEIERATQQATECAALHNEIST